MSWAPDYVTESQLKSYLRISTGSTQDDAELAFAITAASRAVDHACNRQFGIVGSAEARVYTPFYDRRRARWTVDVDDFPSTSTLAIAVDDDDDDVFDVTISTTAVRKYPFNAPDVGYPYTKLIINPASTSAPTSGEGTVQVTAKFGWSSVPDVVEQATLMQASRFFARRNSPYGIAGSPEIGSELRLLNKLDPDVDLALQSVKRRWAAV